MATTGSLWSVSDKWGTAKGTRYYTCPISTLESALNNTSNVPSNAEITNLKLRVTADVDLVGLANIYLSYGFGSASAINKELLGETKFSSFDPKEFPSGGVDITSYLSRKFSTFAITRNHGENLTFCFETANVLSKTMKIESVKLEITYTIHDHSYTVVSETPSTCLDSGSETLQCSCGDTQTNTIPMLPHSYKGAIKNDSNSKTGTHSYKCVNGCNQYGGAKTHTWDSGVQTTAPTCTTNGVKTYTCTTSGCGGKYTETIPAKGHTVVNEPEIPPTCTESGQSSWSYCSECGEILSHSMVLPPLGHDYVSTPGCAYTEYVCSRCGDTYKDSYNALGHDYKETVLIPPTCTEEGIKKIECNHCGDTYTETIPSKGHTVVEIPEVPPTCTESGLSSGSYCPECDLINPSFIIEPLGHDYKETVSIEPTCTEEGSKTFKCSRCGDTYTESIPPKEHTVVHVPGKPPTCTESGYMGYSCCSDCGEELETRLFVEPLGHAEIIDAEVEPTCSTSGKTEGKHCAVCGEVIIAQQDIPSNGHTPDIKEIENKIEPTCTTDGSYDETVYCSVCGEQVSRNKVTVPASGHSFTSYTSDDNATCTNDGTKSAECASCGAVDTVADVGTALGHNYRETVSLAPSCTEEGSKTFKCSRCGDTYIETIPSKGHTVVYAPEVPPTCTEYGSEGYPYCSECGEVLGVQADIEPLGHDYVPNNIVEPDLTNGSYGYTEYICSRCGDSYKADYVYVITFKNGNGSELEKIAVPEGAIPECSRIPWKSSTAEYQYTFKGWSPELGEATANQVYTPIFKGTKRSYNISTGVSPVDSGTTFPIRNIYQYGTEITLTATPNEGYKFVQWEDGNTDNPRTVIVTGGAEYIAIFELDKINNILVDTSQYSEVMIDLGETPEMLADKTKVYG